MTNFPLRPKGLGSRREHMQARPVNRDDVYDHHCPRNSSIIRGFGRKA
jgi:hypothetical protein